MNIHPLLVHFPIGLLVMYAIFEMLRFRSLRALSYWFYVKAIFVIAGTGAAYIAFGGGEIAEEIVGTLDPSKLPLIETHSGFAGATTAVFSILALAYLIVWIARARHTENSGQINNKSMRFIFRSAQFILGTPLAPVFALVGLITMIITGALGASIVYGPDVDPFVKVIYSFIMGR